MKLYELVFNPDLVDGVYGISVVNKPAIKVEAVTFSDEACSCHFSDNESDENTLSILDNLISKGESLEALTGYEEIGSIPVSEIQDFSFSMDIPSDPLGDSEQDNDLFKIRYRLAPNKVSVNSREFCKRLISANKIYRQEDIEEASNGGVNGSFAKKGSSRYDIFLFKGGVNCQHFWERVILFKKDNNEQITSKEARQILNELEPSERHKYRIKPNDKRVAQPAEASNNYWKLASEDKQILTQPILIPDQKIYRSNIDGDEGYVYVTAETIEALQQNFFKQQFNHNSTIEHDSERVLNDVYIFESWIITDENNDKSNALGFSLPVGTWMVSMKVEDSDLWSKIKSGELKGLSMDAVLFPVGK